MNVHNPPVQPPESHMAMTDAELPARMRQIANRISPFDRDAAQRLIAIANQLPDGSNSSKSFDHLLNLDLYQAINADTIERRAVEFKSPSTGLGCLETIRNALVLFPILITWIALAMASYNYAKTVGDPNFASDASKPFLLLWEQGFPTGVFTWLRFSWVAGIDFAILLVIIVLTVYFHFRTEVQSQQIKHKAVELRQEVEDVLWRLSQLFSQRRLLRAPDQGALEAAEKMNQAARTLEETTTALAGHEDRAATRAETLAQRQVTFTQQQEELRKQFGNLTQQQQHLVTQVSSSVQQLDATTKEMQASLEKVSGDLGQAVTSAKEAASAASSGLALAQEAVGEAGRTATAVSGVEKQLGAVVGQLGGVTGSLAQTNRSLDATVNEAARLNQGIQQASQNINAVAVKIDGVAAKIDSVATKIDVLPANLQSISDSLKASAQQTENTARATAGLVSQLGTLVAQLPTISQGMQSVVGSLNNTSQEMAQSVTESRTANQSLHQAVQIFSQGAQQTAQAFSQGTQQTAQSFAQGVQQTSQAFTQNIVRPLVTEVDAIKAQLNYVHQVLQNLPGVGQPQAGYWMRAAKWFTVLLLAALLLPVVILIPWFVTQAAWVTVLGLSIAAILLAALLAATLAWQR